MFGSRKKKKEKISLLVLELTRDFLQNRGINRDFSLDSGLSQAGLGLDSIGRLELLAEVERRCKVQIPERHWEDLSKMTIGNLVEIVWKGR